MTDNNRSYYSEGLLEEAIQENKRLLEADPGNHMLRCSLANSLFRLGNIEEAIKEYKKCIETSPSSEYWNNLGKALLNDGKYEEAIKMSYDVLEWMPDFSGIFWIPLTTLLVSRLMIEG